jgi:DNA polymerase-3 subunit delta
MPSYPLASVAKSGTSSVLSADTRIALLVGKELFLQTEYTARLRKALIERHGEVDTVRFDGQSTPAADVLDECRSLGLMQQHKLVVVDDADQLIRGGSKKDGDGKKGGSRDDEDEEEEEASESGASTRPMFERYAQAPTEGATLVLRARKFIPGKLGPMIEKVGAIIKCEAESADTARRWVVARAPERHGVEVEPAAAALLVERLGADLGRLDNEVAKLAASIGAPVDGKGKKGRLPMVTTEAAAELVGVTREEDMWTIKDALLSGDPEAALHQLHAILDRSGKDQAVPVTWACIDAARQLHSLAQGLRQGKNVFSLAGTLKIWPPARAEAMAAVARKLDPRRAAALLAAAVEADRRTKSGLGDGARTLELLALRFASVGA